VGVFLMAMVYFAFIWRSWFFAVDRPRWDLRADRPYSPLTLLPTLVAAILLVQGFAESGPLLAWGWLFVVMLAFKIKQSPHIGEGAAELRIAIERGDLTTREP
jgi:exopolysaccharide production protein ExoQ